VYAFRCEAFTGSGGSECMPGSDRVGGFVAVGGALTRVEFLTGCGSIILPLTSLFDGHGEMRALGDMAVLCG
jgi:hypothetical protein